MPYSEDTDLAAIRPNILSLGVPDWSDMHVVAQQEIDLALEVKWYRKEAEERDIDWVLLPFVHANADATQLKRLSCFKVLELAYLYLMKDSPEPDGFERQRKLFAELYVEELRKVLDTGISYDWDASGTVGLTERLKPRYRRLARA